MKKISYVLITFFTFLALTGCALTPEMAKQKSTSSLCQMHASSGENFLSPTIRSELLSRGAGYCLTPQYIQGIQRQQAINAQNSMQMMQMGMQGLQNSRPYTIPMNQCVTSNVGGNLIQNCY